MLDFCPWAVSLFWGEPWFDWSLSIYYVYDPVYDKTFMKILKIDTLFMILRSNSTHFFIKCVIFRPCYKKSSKFFEFETLFMSGWSKNHTLKGGTSPYSLCMGVPPPPRVWLDNIKLSCLIGQCLTVFHHCMHYYFVFDLGIVGLSCLICHCQPIVFDRLGIVSLSCLIWHCQPIVFDWASSVCHVWFDSVNL